MVIEVKNIGVSTVEVFGANRPIGKPLTILAPGDSEKLQGTNLLIRETAPTTVGDDEAMGF